MQRIFAFILLATLIPVILITALAIVVLSGFPILFIQERVGLERKTFSIYKFRTMRNGKIRFIGKVLRKTGIDEIPQLINIIGGSMVFVGPRPLTKSDIDRLEWNTSQHNERWTVKPGITGPAQLVNVCDKNVTWQNDIDYVRNKSIKLDLKVLKQSLLVPFIGKSKTKNLIHKSKA